MQMVIRSIKENRCKRWIAFMLLWLFVGYVGSISLFPHRHIIDGQTIYHSHFYAGSADSPNHSHTSQQCNAITALSFYIALTATMAAMAGAMLRNEREVESYSLQGISQRVQECLLLRAPPAFI